MNKKKRICHYWDKQMFIETSRCLLDSHITRMAELILILSAKNFKQFCHLTGCSVARGSHQQFLRNLLGYWANKKTLRQKINICFVFEWVPPRDAKGLKPHPQNRILLPLGVLFKISDKISRPLYMGVLFTWESSWPNNIILKFTLHWHLDCK